MSSEILVKAEGISKKFCRSLKRSLWYGVQDVAGELFGHQGNFNKLRQNEFWALDDVSFELRRGDCLGLIGPNGAGKSTLLKMLNGLIKPDKGKITMRGRVGALIELGAGFNPILTARENIYVNGSVLGFTKKEIDGKFDNIVDFSGLEEFIDTPVQNFSSGMKVRLGFSIASQMEPDVFLIDEVLAVGDASFRTKCIGRIAQLAESSAIIFVSHSMPMIGRMSNKALLLQRGKRHSISYDVPANILEYLKLNDGVSRFINGEDTFEDVGFEVISGDHDLNGKEIEISQFEKFELILHLRTRRELKDYLINVAFFDQEEKNVAETFSVDSGFYIDQGKTNSTVRVGIKKLELNPGKYSVQVAITEMKPNGDRGDIYFVQRGLFDIIVSGKSIGYAPVQLQCDWSRVK